MRYISERFNRLALSLYPLAYRRRYGDEMAALVEDSGATPRAGADLLRGALRAHLRPERSVAEALDGRDRLRLGAATVSFCWLLVAMAIFAFAKTTEDPDFGAAASAHPLLGAAHLALQLLAVLASLAFVLGAAPLAAIALTQVGSRAGVRRAALGAAGCVAVAILATAVVVLVANHNPEPSSGLRTGLIAGWIAVGIITAFGCGLAARRGLFAARIPDPALRLASACAAVVAAAMVGIALAGAVYLAALVADAPSLARQGNGGGLISVGASVGVCLAAIALAAAVGSASALRTRRATLS
jgi:hypothetical protein